MRDMSFRGDYKPPKSNPNIQQQQPYKPQQPRGNPKSYQTRNYRQGNPQNNKRPWRQYGSNPNQQQSNPTQNTTPQRQNHNHNQPQINALLAQIQCDVEANPHANQHLITNLRNLASMMPQTNTDPDNTDTGHHPR